MSSDRYLTLLDFTSTLFNVNHRFAAWHGRIAQKINEPSRALYSFEQDFGGEEKWLMTCHGTVSKVGKMQLWKLQEYNSRRESMNFQAWGACAASVCTSCHWCPSNNCDLFRKPCSFSRILFSAR